MTTFDPGQRLVITAPATVRVVQPINGRNDQYGWTIDDVFPAAGDEDAGE